MTKLILLLLLSGLGHPKFDVRELSTHTLVWVNNIFDVRPFLVSQMDHKDIEVSKRVRYVLEKYYDVYPDDGLVPRISSFPDVHHLWSDIEVLYYEHEPDRDVEFRRRTQAYVLWHLLKGTSRRGVVEMVRLAAAQERSGK